MEGIAIAIGSDGVISYHVQLQRERRFSGQLVRVNGLEFWCL